MVNRCKRVNLANIDAKTLNGWRGTKYSSGNLPQKKWFRVAALTGWPSMGCLIQLSIYQADQTESMMVSYGFGAGYGHLHQIGASNYPTSPASIQIRAIKSGTETTYIEIRNDYTDSYTTSTYQYRLRITELEGNVEIYSTPIESTSDANVISTISSSKLTNTYAINTNNSKPIENELDINGGG